MITLPVIKNFNEVIEPHLHGAKVLTYTSNFLTNPGDNYGSTMLKMTVSIEEPDKTIKNLEIVAKVPPPTEESWKAFRPDITFFRENHCYSTLASELEKLQDEANMPKESRCDIFTKYYGARISLGENTTKADEDAVLLLENLIPHGYKVYSRTEGFDFEHTCVILKHLAHLHALPIALRYLKPEVFDKKFRPVYTRFNMEAGMDEDIIKLLWQAHIRDLRKIPELTENIIEKILKILKMNKNYMSKTEECEDSLFTTLAHYDFWVNNMLLVCDSKGKPINVKIVDFQIAQYESLVHDLVFFLLSSVSTGILTENIDKFFDYYWNEFLNCLHCVGVNTEEYTKEKFLDEINRLAPIQIPHVIIMLKVLFARKDFLEENKNAGIKMFFDENLVEPKFFDKVKEVILLAKDKGWL